MIQSKLQPVAPITVPSSTFGQRLSEERSGWFIGRKSELAALDSALEDPNCSLVYLTGEAGVGKTSLLLEFLRQGQLSSLPIGYVNATEVNLHSADEVQRCYTRHATLLLESARSHPSALRPVLLLDSHERLSAFEPWLLGQFAAGLPSDVLLVIASRQAQSPRLSLDPGWSSLTRSLELAPWPEAEARRFLELHEVPDVAKSAILHAVGGYPLGLAVATEILKRTRAPVFAQEHLRELQRTLTVALELRPTTHKQQLALDVCALAHTTTPELLEHVLSANSSESAHLAPELFEWLASQPFIQHTESGLRPHALARLALVARAQRENAQRYQSIYRPVREFMVAELATDCPPKAGLDDLFFLDRDVPSIEQLSAPESQRGTLTFEPAKTRDESELVELIRGLEGDESAEIARAHFRAELHAFEVSRDEVQGGLLESFWHATMLTRAADIHLAERDPAARLAAEFVRQHPPENGMRALFMRWFANRHDYQKPTPRGLTITARQSNLIMSNERLAYSLCVFRSPEEWAELWDRASSPRQVVGTFAIGPETYTLMAFPFHERSLRDQLVDAWQVPESGPATLAAALEQGQKSKIQQRIAALGKTTKLTEREAQILELLCLGGNFDEIAVRLGISPRTVKFHQENLLRKTGSSSRVELFRKLI
ncbi:MAG TPA: LuxR C-terminal-related transcriptional regulator, partial [Polyangiaceae bacterium]|nr:LuxR C-terminal-related transcriptional regulator [Polyangiaceae bacterium]